MKERALAEVSKLSGEVTPKMLKGSKKASPTTQLGRAEQAARVQEQRTSSLASLLIAGNAHLQPPKRRKKASRKDASDSRLKHKIHVLSPPSSQTQVGNYSTP